MTLVNFLHASEIATIFLDNEFRIKRFTPFAESSWAYFGHTSLLARTVTDKARYSGLSRKDRNYLLAALPAAS